MKVGRTLRSILGGVSQQPQHVRADGQHSEVTNFMLDPSVGLARRWPSRRLADAPAPPIGPWAGTLRRVEFSTGGNDYVVLFPQAPGGRVVAFDLTNSKFLNVVRPDDDPDLDAFLAEGCTAATALGKYVFASGPGVQAQVTETQKWEEFGSGAVWVRGGAFGRKFSVAGELLDGTPFSVEYTLPAASYSGSLDTSGVPVHVADPAGGTIVDTEAAYSVARDSGGGEHVLNWGAWNPTGLTVKRAGVTLTNTYPAAPTTPSQYRYGPDDPTRVRFSFVTAPGDVPVSISYTHDKVVANPNYTKVVGDMTNEYNAAVTDWILSSATAIVPSAVAEKLGELLTAAGVPCSVSGTHIGVPAVRTITADDGGDGTLLRAVAGTVVSVDELTRKHYVGRTVRVRPSENSEPFYMEAEAKIPGETGLTEVVWVEGQRTERVITRGFVFATPSGDSLFLAGSSAKLEGITPGPHPWISKSTVGDEDTSPLPYFVGRTITCLAVTQDRLVVAAGARVRVSAAGDYLNFFRGSVLTAAPDDSFEVTSKHGDDDTIVHAVEYDQSLMLFGRRQYLLSGRVPLSPTNAILPAVSAHAGAQDVQPVVAGGAVFYLLRTGDGTSLHRMRPGQYAESVDTTPESAQLSDYLPNTVTEMVAIPKPAMLLLRCSDSRLRAFTYLDVGGERLMAGFSSWAYSPNLGQLLCAVSRPEGVVLLWAREGKLVADLQPLSVGPSSVPHLDSWAPSKQDATAAAASLSPYYGWVEDAPADKVWGHPSEALLRTSTFFVPDQEGRAQLSGELVVTDITLSLSNSGGATVRVTTEFDDPQEFDWPAEFTDIAEFGDRPIRNYEVAAPVGLVSGSYEFEIKSMDVMPLTITAIRWTGQYFNRTRSI